MRSFCTYFDRRYLTRGLALYDSLERHCKCFRLWVLCLDHESCGILRRLNLRSATLITMAELERGDEGLQRCRSARSAVEYYFTCTPSLMLHVLRASPRTSLLTYLDADTYFFADPAPVYEEIGSRSAAVIDHGFPTSRRHLEIFGKYNVGWVSARRDDSGLGCLSWWRERCLEWCHDRVEAGRFADQAYLNEWPDRFPGVAIIRHPGANVAPWNLDAHRVECRGEAVQVDGAPLLFYHFHALKGMKPWLYDYGSFHYGFVLEGAARRGIYRPYLDALLKASRMIGPSERDNLRQPAGGDLSKMARALQACRALRGIIGGRLLVAPDIGGGCRRAAGAR